MICLETTQNCQDKSLSYRLYSQHNLTIFLNQTIFYLPCPPCNFPCFLHPLSLKLWPLFLCYCYTHIHTHHYMLHYIHIYILYTYTHTRSDQFFYCYLYVYYHIISRLTTQCLITSQEICWQHRMYVLVPQISREIRNVEHTG